MKILRKVGVLLGLLMFVIGYGGYGGDQAQQDMAKMFMIVGAMIAAGCIVSPKKRTAERRATRAYRR